MQLFSNPVLQRELLVNLRKPKAFGLLLMYQVLLAAVVYFAWPSENVRLDLSDAGSSSVLVDLVFLGQYILAALMAPSFAAGSIAGEKERMTYEMLLASPIRPESIVLGKLVAALTHLAVLIFASLPIVMLCLPLGGVSFYEVLAAYLALIASVITFGMISVAAGSFFLADEFRVGCFLPDDFAVGFSWRAVLVFNEPVWRDAIEHGDYGNPWFRSSSFNCFVLYL